MGTHTHSKHHHHDHGHHHDHDDDGHNHHGHSHSHAFGPTEVFRIGLTGLCALALWLQLPDHVYLDIGGQIFLSFSWYGLVGLGIGGWPLFEEAWESIKRRRMTMELSMCIAVVAAAYTGYFLVALMITFFVLIAEVLEGMTLERGRRAIRDLMALLPTEVQMRRDGQVVTASIYDIELGSVVVVAPGARVPVDGPVISGNSFIDESRITGESMPVEKMPGHFVYAGTINQSGALEVRAERVGRATSYGQILDTVEEAERSRAPVQRLADKLAGYIVYVALGFAAFEYWITQGNISATISVIVVAGACGVAAGTPLAILGGIGRAAQMGAIIKGGVHLETLGRVDTVVLDKTGTLTFGRPEITTVLTHGAASPNEVLLAAATAEALSEHPLGKAIISHAAKLNLVPGAASDFRYEPGLGISARDASGMIYVGNEQWMRQNNIAVNATSDTYEGTRILVGRDTTLIGQIQVEDQVRPEARRAIEKLKSMNIDVQLLTGDSAAVANKVAKELGIHVVEASLLPTDKLKRIQAIKRSGRTVAMVGDGVNDAPALATASVGVAMGSGTEVAREKADIVLLGNDLMRFAETVHVARRTRNVIWFNFAGTVAVDVLGIAIAMLGWIGPVEASLIHTGSELAFILNSARLIPGQTMIKGIQSAKNEMATWLPARQH
ncbi:cation-translocating P-type ATPase [Mesorhizobium sp. KR2-14]|uniref:heavy metal translocating P-type ATPase n=1 Tax=Mesorhizobium sp. KR2-14 TaxID=3156610 RepID=UPI0032B36864